MSFIKFFEQSFDPPTRSCTYQSVRIRTSTQSCLSRSKLLQLTGRLESHLSWSMALAVAFRSSTRTMTTSTPTESSTPSISQGSPEALESASPQMPRNVNKNLSTTLKNGGRESVSRNSFSLGTVLGPSCRVPMLCDIPAEWGTSYWTTRGDSQKDHLRKRTGRYPLALLWRPSSWIDSIRSLHWELQDPSVRAYSLVTIIFLIPRLISVLHTVGRG